MRRSDKDKPNVRQFLPTCGHCDDGWLHCVYRVARYTDGKRLTELIGVPRDEPYRGKEVPAGAVMEGKSISYFRAVKRCACLEQQIVQREELEPMPRKIRDVRVGDLVKGMPEPGKLVHFRKMQ